MMRVAFIFLLLCGLVALISASRAAEGGQFRQSVTLANGMILVAEESSLEPRSVGSYSLRLYSATNPDFPYDDFRSGLILARDGIIEAVEEVPPEQCRDCVMVCIRSVGSGSYPVRHYIGYGGGNLALRGATSPSARPGGCTDPSTGELSARH